MPSVPPEGLVHQGLVLEAARRVSAVREVAMTIRMDKFLLLICVGILIWSGIAYILVWLVNLG